MFSNKFDTAFAGFPQDKMYCLYIDYHRQQEGEYTFDEGEPGYRNAMVKGFEFVKSTIDERANAAYLVKLHDTCVGKVQAKEHIPGAYGSTRLVEIKKGFYPRYYGFVKKRASAQALKELEEEKLVDFHHSSNPSEYLSRFDDPNEDLGFPEEECMPTHIQSNAQLNNVEQKVDALFQRYYKKLTLATGQVQTVNAIVELCRALEIYHVFYDGNQRTIAFALLNKLLIENGLSPCILDDPIVFDGYCSIEELRLAVEKGQGNFRAHLKEEKSS